MTGTFRRSKYPKIDHTTFGGFIFHSDFNTDCRGKDNKHGSPIASRIIQDQKFDKECKNNINIRRRNYKND